MDRKNLMPPAEYQKRGEQLSLWMHLVACGSIGFAFSVPFATDVTVRMLAILGLVSSAMSSFVLSRYIRNLTEERLRSAALERMAYIREVPPDA